MVASELLVIMARTGSGVDLGCAAPETMAGAFASQSQPGAGPGMHRGSPAPCLVHLRPTAYSGCGKFTMRSPGAGVVNSWTGLSTPSLRPLLSVELTL